MFKHNKKRNIGLVYEFLNRWITSCILENNDLEIVKTKNILEKHFDKNSELFKELKLFKSLNETKELNRESSKELIEKIKKYNKNINESRLELEKTALIHEINKKIGKSNLFDQQIDEYKTFATIQIALNTWRSSDKILEENISEIHLIEEQLIENLQSPKKIISNEDDSSLFMTNEDVDNLVVNLLSEKINNKYSNILNEKQREILGYYASDNKTEMKILFEEIKGYIENYHQNSSYPKELKEKIEDVLELLYEHNDLTNLNLDTIYVYMGAAELEKELKESII